MYNQFDPHEPSGLATPAETLDKMRLNQIALRDDWFFTPVGWSMTAEALDGDLSKPTTLIYSNGTLRRKTEYVWGTADDAGAEDMPMQATFSVSDDGGSTWQVVSKKIFVYDADSYLTNTESEVF